MDTKLEKNNEHQLAVVNDYIQMMPVAQAKGWYDDFVSFSKSIMKTDLDFGVIPGTPKPSLYKAGAEKLRFVYGLGVEFECIDKVVDLDKPFIDYAYKCSVKSKTGQVLAQCEGSCNSLEPKFGYLWKSIKELPEGTDISRLPVKTSGKVASEFDFAVNKAETTGQYGKPKEYWDNWITAINSGKAKKVVKKSKAGKELDAWEMDTTVTLYRIMNPDVIGVKNTIMKMAQKRAFVGAILLATGASEFFTQDIEDMEINGAVYSDVQDVPFEEVANTGAHNATSNNVNKAESKEQSPFTVPGHWYAKLEKCKTPEEIDELAVKNKETIQGSPDLRKVFNEYKASLKSKMAAA